MEALMFGPWSFRRFHHDPESCFAGGGRGRHHRHRGGHHGHGGDGPGPGGGDNPWGGNPFGGNPWSFFFRGRKTRRGDVRAAILALLSEQPRNGYQIMQELEQRSGGVWRPSPGSVYPALQLLQDEDLVKAEESGGGRVFQLTEHGRAYVKEHAEDVAAPWEAARAAAGEDLPELLGLAHQVGVAAAQVAHAGTPAHVAEARKVLQDARRALYRILAEDAPEHGR
ncbi:MULTISPECIES: PadR family transcriptional regulator [unclassified Anaeromyxobacter]|uniref:PadR family transcriptional regulator n=1 Tax=unclassified Anaeromyxobacter TaxID=2620896 RepID=UPI001F5760C4|nr:MULTISPECIES: PadR family transcriptional regulator [unclassified Anaeromyxobacter]